MSITYTKILRGIEKECGFDVRGISNNTQRKSDFTDDINLAMDDVFQMIFSAGGTWQFDDKNHADYPIISTDLVSGQRDYSFTADSAGNLVLDIYKVVVKGTDGIKREIYPVDMQTRNTDNVNVDSMIDGQNKTGVPTRYDKTANGIFLDLIPNYDSEDGLEIYINREGSYFTTSDTTKKAGFSGLYHEYLILHPSYRYARQKSLPNVARLNRDIEKMQVAIKNHYGQRERDIIRRLTPNIEE